MRSLRSGSASTPSWTFPSTSPCGVAPPRSSACLTARGPLHHRQVKLPDLLIAAAAELAALPVLHYDRDFEAIADVTGQPVRAIAPLGSL